MTTNGRYRVLVVGCGELGSRHLQAVASLPEVQEIEVVDSRPESLSLGQQRLAELPEPANAKVVRWLPSLEEAHKDGDLCIVATQAKGRCQLVQDVADTLDYPSFLLEKIVGQSVGEIEGLQRFCQKRTIDVRVNLQTRAYPFHQRAKGLLDPDSPMIFSVVGGNHGLATNGVHNADLFAFYDDATFLKSSGSSVDPVLHPSKRGASLIDLSGTLAGYTDKGSRFTLSYARNHENSEQIIISSDRYRCIVDHSQRWAVESDADSDWLWREAPFEGDLLVSHMTKKFAAEILHGGPCELPTLSESMVAHRFILDELKPHVNRLMGQKSDLCPVT